ncbi:hypothetical protein GGQ74_001175 [Desulfobaculum xiamenense]|uniref:Uncharacterized protein n=2 Tax=Desulfobaculum xiamenense TaxID=995050 RepID=A0A846QQ57_9BACT|nr:hypothetical protein [Desulfobaculum xiamenense]
MRNRNSNGSIHTPLPGVFPEIRRGERVRVRTSAGDHRKSFAMSGVEYDRQLGWGLRVAGEGFVKVHDLLGILP